MDVQELKLLRAARGISDALHHLEVDGFEPPEYLEAAWAVLTEAIEEYSL